MFRNFKRLLRGLGVSSLILPVFLAAGPKIEWASCRGGELTILAEEAAPFNYRQGDRPSGSSVAIVDEILHRLRIDAEIKIVPWARGYQQALTEPDVVLFSMARSEARNDLFHWVGPLVEVQSAFYALRDAPLVIETIEDARQVSKIGVRRSDVREQFLTSSGFHNLDPTNSNESNLRKLLNGRIDLWATSNLEAASAADQLGIDRDALRHIFTFQKFRLYIAISRRSSPQLAADWQDALDSMKSDGTFMALSRQWLPAESLPKEVSRPSAAWDGGSAISVYTENSPPGSYVEDGRLKGPAVQVVEEIMRRLSLTSGIEVVPWARGYHMARTRPNVALFATSRLPQRESLFKWVGPLYTQQWGLYARRDAYPRLLTLEDARAVPRIGTYREDAKEQYLKSIGFQNLVSTNNNLGNVRHLIDGTIDLWVSSDFNMPCIVRYSGYDPRKLRLALSLKTVGNYIAFSLATPDRIVARWQRAFDTVRRDGTWARYFDEDLAVRR